MNICISSDGFPTPEHPYSAFIGILCEELTKQNDNIQVIAPQSLTKHFLRGTPLFPKKFTVDVPTTTGIKKIYVHRPYSITFGNGRFAKLTILFNRLSFESAFKKLKKKPDICYAHFWISGFNALKIAQKNNIPLFVATGEDTISIHKHLSDKELINLKEYTKGVICVSTKNKEESIQKGLTTSNKCKIIPNAINPLLFYHKNKMECRQMLGYHNNDFIIAFVGRFIKRKGSTRVSDAISYIADQNIKSIFIGSPIQGENAIPTCPGILFQGTLPHNKIVNYLNAADVFVLPTLAEGCSNSIVEAMACGLPIISSDLPFNHDILNKDNAILINPTDTKEIAQAILMLKNNKELCQSMSKASLISAAQLTIPTRVHKIKEFINQQLNNKK